MKLSLPLEFFSSTILPNQFVLMYLLSFGSENVGLIGLTRVGSRRVIQIAALFMLFFSVFGESFWHKEFCSVKDMQ